MNNLKKTTTTALGLYILAVICVLGVTAIARWAHLQGLLEPKVARSEKEVHGGPVSQLNTDDGSAGVTMSLKYGYPFVWYGHSIRSSWRPMSLREAEILQDYLERGEELPSVYDSLRGVNASKAASRSVAPTAFALNTVAATFVVCVTYVAIRCSVRRSRRRAKCCMECGYCLVDLTALVCPECGTKFNK